MFSKKDFESFELIKFGFYFNYYNKLERLWYDLEHNTLDNETCKNYFFDIKQSEDEINQIVNETIRSKPKKIVDKAKTNSDNYFKLTFNT